MATLDISDDKTYEIIHTTYTYKGRLTITREHTITRSATWADVMMLLARPERWPGEREDTLEELADCGCASYQHYSIIENI